MVIWHVDNLMGLCKTNFELTKFSCYLAGIYGPKLSMHTGRKHNYLGVDMEFNDDGTLDVLMIPYLKNAITDFPELIVGRAATPAADHLFVIRDEMEARPLEEERALAFHHTVAQLLFMSTRARQDIQNRTEQLRKLGKLQCYYLDQFNQKESSYATSKGCKTALQSEPHREGSLLPGFCVPGKCSGHLGDSYHMQIRVAHQLEICPSLRCIHTAALLLAVLCSGAKAGRLLSCFYCQ